MKVSLEEIPLKKGKSAGETLQTSKPEKKEQEPINGGKIVGDIAKSIVAILTLIFLALLMGHELGYLDLFSMSYLENGFCISNLDKSVTV